MLKIIFIIILFFCSNSFAKINSVFKIYTSVGFASLPNEIKKNRAELAFNLGASYEFYKLDNLGFSLNSALGLTDILSSGSNNTFVKPIFYGFSNDLMLTYKILGERIAFLPSLGIATRLGFVHVYKKVINKTDSHTYFLYGIGPKLSLGYQILDIGLAISYALELGKQNLRQEVATLISYSFF